MIKLGVRCTVQKSRPGSNLGAIAPPGLHPQKCGVRLRRWRNQHRLCSYTLILVQYTGLLIFEKNNFLGLNPARCLVVTRSGSIGECVSVKNKLRH